MMQKTVGIFTLQVSNLPSWDPDSIHRGINGSEEAVIYSSQELSRLGYKVTVFNEPPIGSVHTSYDANPRFTNFLPNNLFFDIIILCRSVHPVEYLKNRSKKIYFWPQDICTGKIKQEVIEAFDDVFWISSWQREQWISINPSFSKFKNIFGNAVDPSHFPPVEKKSNPYSCIYASNYARGLSVLLKSWPKVKEKFPKSALDIYYGWQHWGCMSEHQEQELKSLVQDLKKLDVQDHGQVSHKELSNAFAKTSFWTYPCIQPETFCITALKAQISGAVPVIINGSALSEVVRSGFRCDRASAYQDLLLLAMSYVETISPGYRREIGAFIHSEYSWKKIVSSWVERFNFN